MTERSWWRDGVIYQIYPRSWSDSNDDGVGDLRGIISRLDYLEWLGVDGVWLSPITVSPDDDWGYDVADYTGVHPELGTIDDAEELIAEAREQSEGEDPHDAGFLEEHPRLPLPVRRLLAGLGVIAALAVVLWLAESRTGWNGIDRETRVEATRRFSAEASRIADKPVRIRCDESGDYVGAVQHADGVAAIGGRLAFLTPQRCYDLYRLAEKGEVSFSQTARAIAVLAHEAWHLRGVRDEGTTECYALQSGVDLGTRLGLSETTARRMMRQQLAENTLRSGSTIEYRVPAECRDGGGLDLKPGESAFP